MGKLDYGYIILFFSFIFIVFVFQLTPDDKDIKTNWEKDIKNGQDYLRKASSMIITKAPESETPDDNIQPKVCFNFLIIIIMCVTY